ncbi:MAG: hypothetical protein WCJ30_19640 [Deltaproteobacteria bacterium]
MRATVSYAAFGVAAILITTAPPGGAQTAGPPGQPAAIGVPAVPVAPPVPPPVDPRTLFAGTFVPDAGPGNRGAIEAGINRAVAGFFFLVRGMAHDRISQGNPIFPFIRFAFPPGVIEMVAGSYVVRSADTGGESTTHGLDDHTNRLTQRFSAPDRLVQVTWNDDGRRQSDYVISADGRTLVLSVVITSGRLPQPVRYTMRYHRS